MGRLTAQTLVFSWVPLPSAHFLGHLLQWSTGSGFWSPIRLDIRNILDLDWILFLFNRIHFIQMKGNLATQKL